MVDTKALLKGFGAAADVAGQIATDKAINSRRQSRGTITSAVRTEGLTGGLDITEGQLLEDLRIFPTSEATFSHDLGRVPIGAFILRGDETAVCTGTTVDTVTIKGTVAKFVTVWVV